MPKTSVSFENLDLTDLSRSEKETFDSIFSNFRRKNHEDEQKTAGVSIAKFFSSLFEICISVVKPDVKLFIMDVSVLIPCASLIQQLIDPEDPFESDSAVESTDDESSLCTMGFMAGIPLIISASNVKEKHARIPGYT